MQLSWDQMKRLEQILRGCPKVCKLIATGSDFDEERTKAIRRIADFLCSLKTKPNGIRLGLPF